MTSDIELDKITDDPNDITPDTLVILNLILNITSDIILHVFYMLIQRLYTFHYSVEALRAFHLLLPLFHFRQFPPKFCVGCSFAFRFFFRCGFCCQVSVRRTTKKLWHPKMPQLI